MVKVVVCARTRILLSLFVCFDFEAYQRDFDEKVDADEENSLEVEEGTSWNKVHVPESFSAGCNSGALWQGSNSKIENYGGFLAAVALFGMVLH